MKKDTILILKDKLTISDNSIQSNLEDEGYTVITTNRIDIALKQKGQIALAMIDVNLTGCTKIEGEMVNEQLAGILLASKLQTTPYPAIILRTTSTDQPVVMDASKKINAVVLDIETTQNAVLEKVKELIPKYPIKKCTSSNVMQKINPALLTHQNPILPPSQLEKQQRKIGLKRKRYYKETPATQTKQCVAQSNNRLHINGPTICKT